MGGVDNLCTLYDVTSGSVLRELSSHDSYLSCCRFVRDEATLLTSSGDSTCILWDVGRGVPLAHFNDHANDVMSMAVSPTDVDVFVSGSSDATAKVWDIRIGKSVCTFGGHDSDVSAVSFHSDGFMIASASDDGGCRMFDMRCPFVLREFRSSQVVCGVSAVDFSKVRLPA